jgi:hypothetical protein
MCLRLKKLSQPYDAGSPSKMIENAFTDILTDPALCIRERFVHFAPLLGSKGLTDIVDGRVSLISRSVNLLRHGRRVQIVFFAAF